MKRREFNKTLLAGAAGLAGLGAAVPEKKWKYRCGAEVPPQNLPTWVEGASEFLSKPLLSNQKRVLDDIERERGRFSGDVPYGYTWFAPAMSGKTHLALYLIAKELVYWSPGEFQIAVLDCSDRMKREWAYRLAKVFYGNRAHRDVVFSEPWRPHLINLENGRGLPSSQIWIFDSETEFTDEMRHEFSVVDGYRFDMLVSENCDSSGGSLKKFKSLVSSVYPGGFSFSTSQLLHGS